LQNLTPRERLLRALEGSLPDRVPYFEYAIDVGVARGAFGRCPDEPLEFNRMVGRCDLEVWRKPPVFARYERTSDGRTHLTGGSSAPVATTAAPSAFPRPSSPMRSPRRPMPRRGRANSPSAS